MDGTTPVARPTHEHVAGVGSHLICEIDGKVELCRQLHQRADCRRGEGRGREGKKEQKKKAGRRASPRGEGMGRVGGVRATRVTPRCAVEKEGARAREGGRGRRGRCALTVLPQLLLALRQLAAPSELGAEQAHHAVHDQQAVALGAARDERRHCRGGAGGGGRQRGGGERGQAPRAGERGAQGARVSGTRPAPLAPAGARAAGSAQR